MPSGCDDAPMLLRVCAMIIWLASYPRSGNTLLRLMLKSVYGLESYSKYNDPDDIGRNPSVKEAVGHRFWKGRWDDAYKLLSDNSETVFVKTHDVPDDDAKAIYVVRDGRQACASYCHYLNHYYDATVTLESVISGTAGRFPSWGLHLDEWNPKGRANTLFLKYTDLVDAPQEQLDKISSFCGISQNLSWENDFQKLHSIEPNFFRAGSSGGKRDAFTQQQEELFWTLHGDWMVELGFESGSDFEPKPILRKYFVPLKPVEERGFNAAKLEYSLRLDQLNSDHEQLSNQNKQLSSQCEQLSKQCMQFTEQSSRLRNVLMTYDEFHKRYAWFLRLLPGYPDGSHSDVAELKVGAVAGRTGKEKSGVPLVAGNKRPTRTFQEFFSHINGLGFNPGTVIDVGVARGTPALYEAFPDAYLILVEPVKEFVPHLEAILQKRKGEFHNCALMAEPGTSTILKTKELHGSSMMHRVADSGDARLQEVEVRTLDDVVGGDRATPYLLKTDCQGGDYEVVKGGERTLVHCEVVILEVSFFKFWGDHHPDPLDIIQYMSDHGFVLYDFLDGLFRPNDNALGQIDMVFVKRDGLFRKSHKWGKD